LSMFPFPMISLSLLLFWSVSRTVHGQVRSYSPSLWKPSPAKQRARRKTQGTRMSLALVQVCRPFQSVVTRKARPCLRSCWEVVEDWCTTFCKVLTRFWWTGKKDLLHFRTRTLRFDSLIQPRLHSKPSDCRINDEQESGKNAWRKKRRGFRSR
jgi:hypothetical protein